MERLIVKEFKSLIRNSIVTPVGIFDADREVNLHIKTPSLSFSMSKQGNTYQLTGVTGIENSALPTLSQENLKQLFDMAMMRHTKYFQHRAWSQVNLYHTLLSAKAQQKNK